MANIYPSKKFLEIVDLVRSSSSSSIRICEIGVDRGATTLEVIKKLQTNDTIDLFDFEECFLFKNRYLLDSFSNININFYTNTTRTFDSYSWSLANLFLHLRTSSVKIFDAAYLDGAHTFHVDAPTTCILKEMIKVGGYLVFDDMQWSLSSNPTCNTPGNREARYTYEQMTSCHVEIIVDIFMRTDIRFVELTNPGEPRSVFIRNS